MVPGCDCGVSVVSATAAPSSSASSRGENGNDSKETGNLGVVRREVVREVALDMASRSTLFFFWTAESDRLSSATTIMFPISKLCLVFLDVLGDACEPDKLLFSEKGSDPHSFPSYPGLLVVGKPHTNTLCIIHATVRNGELGTCSDYGGLGDWYMCIFHHLLVEFLFSDVKGKSLDGVDWFVEFVKVVVNLGLGSCCVVAYDIVIDVANGERLYPRQGL